MPMLHSSVMAHAIVQRDGPHLSPTAALNRLAGEPTLVMLHGGASGWTYLAWGMSAQPYVRTSLPHLVQADRSAHRPKPSGQTTSKQTDGSAWSDRFTGGWFIQLDYEYPSRPAALWPVDAFVAWSPDGRCTLNAQSMGGLDRLDRGLARPELAIPPVRLASRLTPDWSAADHQARIDRIRSYIVAGDIYQANLTMSCSARMQPGAHQDIAAFIALTAASPAPFAALLRTPERSIISHSPECFLTVYDRVIASEPIKGTCRRIPGKDESTRARLLSSDKDRAELAMIVDLMRNDLGRVAVPGSVVVTSPARVLDLPHVHHLVARIEGHLREDVALGDILASAFPAGSVTGAPKQRAMAIIQELEARQRGAYCGSFGWISHDGACELAVAIRTLVMTGDHVQLAAGGGIVSDSVPASEWDELHAKASAMAAALGTQL